MTHYVKASEDAGESPAFAALRNPESDGNLSKPMLGQLNDDSEIPTIAQTLCRWDVWSLMIYVWLLAFSVIITYVLAPEIGAAYFNDSAATYGLYYGIWSSIGGFVGFTVQGYIGELSDMYGRKPIMFFTWCTLLLSQGSFNFTRNIWWWLVMIPVAQLSGTFGGINGTTQSALADMVHPARRTLAFGVLYGTVGVIVVIASLAAAVLVKYFGITGAIYAFDIGAFVSLLWVLFVFKETLPEEIQRQARVEYKLKRTKSRRLMMERNVGCIGRCCNAIVTPFKVFARMRDSQVLFWMTILSFFTMLPECGLQDMVAVYLLYLLDDKYFDGNSDKQAYFNSVGVAAAGIAMLVAQAFLLPILNKVFKGNDLALLNFGIMVLLLLCCIGIYVYFCPRIWIGIMLRACVGLSFIISPITTSALSKRLDKNEQGTGIGILQAMKGVTYTISPVIFTFLLKIFENRGYLVTMPWMVSIVFFAAALPVLWGPVRRALNEYDEKKLRQSVQGNVSPLADAEEAGNV